MVQWVCPRTSSQVPARPRIVDTKESRPGGCARSHNSLLAPSSRSPYPAPAPFPRRTHSMAQEPKTPLFLAVAVLIAGSGGFLLGRYTAQGASLTDGGVAGEGARDATPIEAENVQLKQRLAELEREREATSASTPRTDASPAEASADAPKPSADAPEVATGALFSDPRFAALDAIDWKTIGATTGEMAPMLVQLMQELEKTGEVPTALLIKLQTLNSKLVEQVPALLEAGLPGYGPNGAYTHPLVTANVLGSALLASGQPLSDAQRKAIDGLARSFSGENESLAASTREFELEGMLAEAEMKDRFFAEISSQLTPEQLARIEPQGAADFDGASMFRSSLMTRAYTDAVGAKDPADFARIASGRLGEQLSLDEATATQVRSVMERMANNAPELFRDKASPVESKLRMLKQGRTTAALRQQIAMLREIQRTVPLTAEQKKKLQSLRHVLVPLPK